MKAFKTAILLTALALTSCQNIQLIEMSENLGLANKKSGKIICIDPRFYFEKDEDNYDLRKVDKITRFMKNNMEASGKKHNLDFELLELDEKATPGYYEDLLRLKINMLAVNFNQKTPLNFSPSVTENTIHKKVFVYPPKISHEFNGFSKIYGSPYYSYLGIYKVGENLILYHLVVDTDDAETIYREYKVVKSKVNKEVIAQMIYDSYAMLETEFNKR